MAEVPGVIAVFAYFCLFCFVFTCLLVGAFALAPHEVVDRLAARASHGATDSPRAWVMFAGTFLISLALDGVGALSFTLPGIGEFADVVWAPISALAVGYLTDSRSWASLNFVEEALPFTDIIPTATLAWAWKHWPFIFVALHRAVPSLRARNPLKTTEGHRD
mmetsp:Transcript_93036/g.199531  ORF Transcript_93036/g.199531 Transcript_93036/m.199531 type:complete len:163 (+) Transcript_93036:72-560(+)